jgi:hypothetical protein
MNLAYFLAYSFPRLMCPDSDMVIARWLHHLESIFYDNRMILHLVA